MEKRQHEEDSSFTKCPFEVDFQNEAIKASLEKIWSCVPNEPTSLVSKMGPTRISLLGAIPLEIVAGKMREASRKYATYTKSRVVFVQAISGDILFSYWINQSIHTMNCKCCSQPIQEPPMD